MGIMIWIGGIIPILAAFLIVYQDWWIPKRRRLKYEEMRRSVRGLSNSEFDVDQ